MLLETAEVEIRKISLAIINKSLSPGLNEKIKNEALVVFKQLILILFL